MHRVIRLLVASAVAVALAARVRADTLDQIQKRGTLRWGGDQSGGGPYIYEANGNLTGFEVDLADHLARSLGVRSEFVQGQWDKLPQLLNRGDIDIVLNGYEWSPEREAEWASTIPYYMYTLQLLARSGDRSIHSWDDLASVPGAGRRRVGVLMSSAAERYVQSRFGAAVELKAYDGVTNAMELVEQGQLDATVQDLPIALHYGPEFPSLRRVGEPVAPGYYCIFVKRDDRALRGALDRAIRGAIEDGTLRSIYERYGIWNTDQERLGERAAAWPPAPAGGTLGGTGAAAPGADWLYYTKLLARAAGTTVLLSCSSMPLAMLVGLTVAIGRLYGPRWVGWPLEAYVEFLRGTPLLLQLYVIYYVLPNAGIRIPAFWAGVLGLAVNYSAYEAENYRAGLLAIPRGQMEAALALGMSMRTALARVIIPQAVRIVIPPVTNDFIALFKDTSVCSVIAVTELTGMYNRLYNNHPRLVLELGLMTAALYLLMSYPLSLVARRLERRFKRVVV
jgi:polar amino acid transport system substrate-binding protein